MDLLKAGVTGMFAIIGVLIGLVIIIGVATPIFPILINQVVGLSTLGNFTFASLFASGGFVPLLLSVFILLLVIGLPISAIVVAVGYVRGKGGR